MMQRSLFGAAGVAAAGVAAMLAVAAASVPAAAHDPAVEARVGAQAEASGERLGSLIRERLRADGPFLTAEEQSVIERACGYERGSWDGHNFSISDDVVICPNGRRVDSPEVRAVAATAGPRIRARVRSILDSPEVRAAMDRVGDDAAAEALRAVERARPQIEAATRQAAEEARRAVEAARPAIDAATRQAIEEARLAVEAARPQIEAAMREAEAATEQALRDAEESIERARRERRR